MEMKVSILLIEILAASSLLTNLPEIGSPELLVQKRLFRMRFYLKLPLKNWPADAESRFRQNFEKRKY